jgi:hypothetical protein
VGGKGGLAYEVRTGLEDPSNRTKPENESRLVAMVNNSDIVKVDPLSLVTFNKTARRHVAEFGATMALVCVIFAGIKGWYRGPEALQSVLIAIGIAAVFAGAGYLTPRLLHPVWAGWMKLAHMLSMVMTFVVLTVAWIGAFLPMAALLKICRKKVMDTSFDRKALTYWEDRDPKYDDFKRLERQF